MRRFLPAAVIALLMVAVATPANAGYLIIRVILEGGGDGGSASQPGGMGTGGMKPGGGGMSGGSGGYGYGQRGQQGQRPPNSMPSSMRPPGSGMMSPPPGLGGSGSAGARDGGEFQHDATRSLVIVVPVEEDLRQSMGFYQRTGSTRSPIRSGSRSSI